MKLKCVDGVVRRFEVAHCDGYRTIQDCFSDAFCVECGIIFGYHDTKILKSKFKNHVCIINFVKKQKQRLNKFESETIEEEYKDMSVFEFWESAFDQMLKLRELIVDRKNTSLYGYAFNRSDDIMNTCADIYNYMMMIFNRVGKLKVKEGDY